jgi:hypothetical protein
MEPEQLIDSQLLLYLAWNVVESSACTQVAGVAKASVTASVMLMLICDRDMILYDIRTN